MDKLVSLCKRRGFIFQSSEIYGGTGSVWDYGPLGVELKRNLQERWWSEMVRTRENIEGLDSAILMHPRVWEASGHVSGFVDPIGRVSATVPAETEGWSAQKLVLDRRVTPYTRVGDAFPITCVAATAVVCVAGTVRNRRNRSVRRQTES